MVQETTLHLVKAITLMHLLQQWHSSSNPWLAVSSLLLGLCRWTTHWSNFHANILIPSMVDQMPWMLIAKLSVWSTYFRLYFVLTRRMWCTTYYLNDVVNRWCRVTWVRLQAELGEGVLITCKHFNEVSMDCFFQLTLWKNRARQFMDLTQWMMTVNQYAAGFIKLSHFASYLIPNEEKKA